MCAFCTESGAMKGFISGLPKVELHLHIEGTLEPEMLFTIAQKNGVTLPFESIAALRDAYQFNDLQSFLDLYYWGAKVLRTEQDFYDLTFAYLERCHDEHVMHTEIFFDPQSHMQNGVAFATVLNGIDRALQEGKVQWGISSGLILCFYAILVKPRPLKRCVRHCLTKRKSLLLAWIPLKSVIRLKNLFKCLRWRVKQAGQRSRMREKKGRLRIFGVH
ncbi:adenosine deaminase [Photobacterium aphoticum]|uniref:Adenosine deaminase n=1 Tax=Photobacterium aphoticum TaxID=754436 RepID=A0A090QHD2_9GAMM|nr:adenosine deaminase [Photobacterium aphoticum]